MTDQEAKPDVNTEEKELGDRPDANVKKLKRIDEIEKKTI